MTAREHLGPQFGAYERQYAMSKAVPPARYDRGQATDRARALLREHGHPGAERLTVMPWAGGYSSASHDNGNPFLLLNHADMNEHGVTHEVAHLLEQHATGTSGGGSQEDAHGASWDSRFASLLDEPSRKHWQSYSPFYKRSA